MYYKGIIFEESLSNFYRQGVGMWVIYIPLYVQVP